MVLCHENDFAQFNFQKPILTITVKKSSPTKEEWEWTKETMVTYYKTIDSQNYKISIIFDLRKLGILDLGIFRDWAELFKEYKEYTKRCIHRTSILTDNTTIKIGLNLFFSIYTTVRPMKFVDNVAEGLEFVTTEYQEETESVGQVMS